MRLCIYLVPGPVGSVSSIVDTTWAVISWSVPSYIPSDYPIITYEIGYHILQSSNCLMVDNDDFNTEISQLLNSTNAFIIITGLNDMSCYIFGVRAYTDKGYGDWTVIANETLPPCFPSVSDTSSDSVIGLGLFVCLLCILLTVSIVINIFCFIRYSLHFINKNILLFSYRKNMKSHCTTNKQTRLVYFIIISYHTAIILIELMKTFQCKYVNHMKFTRLN